MNAKSAPLFLTICLLFMFFSMPAATFGAGIVPAPSNSSPPPLPSPSVDYWSNLTNSLLGLRSNLFFPDGIPAQIDFRDWLASETNVLAREKGVCAILRRDGTNAIPFLQWMAGFRPEWTSEETLAYAEIDDFPPWWDSSHPSRWTAQELAVFSDFFRSRMPVSTNWQSRVMLDRFFLRADSTWKSSPERLVFLERSLALSRTETASNSILRLMECRLTPEDTNLASRIRVRW